MAGKNYVVSMAFNVLGGATKSIGRIGRAVKSLKGNVSSIGRQFGFQKLGSGVMRLGGSLGNLKSQLLGAVGPLSLLTGAGLLVGLTKSVNGMVAAGDAAGKLSRQLGVSVVGFQQLNFWADRASLSQEEVQQNTRQLNLRLADAASGKNKNVASLFQKLGISLRDMNGDVRDAVDVMPELADAFRQNENAAIKTSMAAELFGGRGIRMITLLEQGSDALKSQGDELLRYGVMTEDQTRAAEEFADEQTNMSYALKGVSNEVGAKLLPILKPMIIAFREWLVLNRDVIALKVQETFKSISEALEKIDFKAIFQGFKDLLRNGSELVDKVGGWKVVLTGMALVSMAPLIASVLSVIASLWSLGTTLVTTTIPAVAKLTFALFTRAIPALGRFALSALASGVPAMIGLAGSILATAIPAVIAFGAALLTTPIGWIALGIAGLVAVFANWGDIVDYFGKKWDRVKKAFDKGFFKGLVSIVTEFNPFTILIDSAVGFLSWISESFDIGSLIGDKIKAVANALPDWMKNLLPGFGGDEDDPENVSGGGGGGEGDAPDYSDERGSLVHSKQPPRTAAEIMADDKRTQKAVIEQENRSGSSSPRQEGIVTVKFENAPKGLKAYVSRASNLDIDLDVGESLAGGGY